MQFQSTPSAWRETGIYNFDNVFCVISIHSLRMEGDIFQHRHTSQCLYFNPLPPHGGRRTSSFTLVCRISISIHSLRMEGDLFSALHGYRRFLYFNPLPPHGGRRNGNALVRPLPDFNPLPPHGGRPVRHIITNFLCYFNPLPPHGGRHNFSPMSNIQFSFQSTPSAWRETLLDHRVVCDRIFQSTPSAWRETTNFCKFIIAFFISIHSLRMEGDQIIQLLPSSYNQFQSTPSAWRETNHLMPLDRDQGISIHSLRMEGDSKTAQESVFHFAYPCTILQKRMQKTTFCTRKNGFFRKKGEKFGAKPSASFCAPMIRTDTFPLNFSHRISGSSMSMVSFAPICSTFD